VPTETLTLTPAPTITPTPTVLTATPTLTPNATQTLALQRTATFAACTFDYGVIDQTPPDGDDGPFVTVNTPYERVITLINTGTCDWERNVSLTFVEGESFNAGPRIFIREPVAVGEEVQLVFQGDTPSRGQVEGGEVVPVEGTWQLRTPGQIPIGDPLIVSVLVYDPG
jgi:hypothetical protein